MHARRHARAALLLVLAGLTTAGCTTTGPGDGFEPLFDSVSLGGWQGDPAHWSVEDGAIVGRVTADAPLAANTFLIRIGPPVEDFELRVEVMLRGDNNSGIQYRARRGDGFRAFGYQCDIHPRPEYNGMLYEEGGRGIVATQGSRIRIEPGGAKTPTAEPAAPFAVAPDVWHEYVVIARGPRLEHRIGDRVTVVVEDFQLEHAARRGILALQLHAGAPYEVRFRNVRLRRIEGPAADR
jgi:hypothetical protein